jgi:hypothetical protein
MAMRRTAFALTAGLVALGLTACGGAGPTMPGGDPDPPMMMQSNAAGAGAQAVQATAPAAAKLAQDDARRAGKRR